MVAYLLGFIVRRQCNGNSLLVTGRFLYYKKVSGRRSGVSAEFDTSF